MEQCVVEIVRTYSELLNHKMRKMSEEVEPFTEVKRVPVASPGPDPETQLV